MSKNQSHADSERMLLAVDESDATQRMLRYVAHIVGSRPHVEVILYHRLPTLPTQLREHGGSEDPDVETALDRETAQGVAEWVDSQQHRLHPILEKLKSDLARHGISRSAIDFYVDEEVICGETLAAALRRVAHERDCHTVVVARDHLPGIGEFFHHHTGDALVHRGVGFAVWVIE